MRYSHAHPGRVFILRLEDGDVLHTTVEQFCRDQQVQAAAVIVVGGADRDSKLVVGPEDGRARPVTPMELTLTDVHEITGTGTVFPNESGAPILHMHIAGGRRDKTVSGCVRRGVRTWVVAEIVLFELTGSTAVRRREPDTGFELLDP